MNPVIWTIVSCTVSTIVGAAGLLFGILQRKKYKSPFLHKYPPGHPMSPIPDMNAVNKQAEKIYSSHITEIPGVDLNSEKQHNLLKALIPFTQNHKIGETGRRFSFDNYFFTGTDAVLLQGLMRHFKPAKIVEIGSGYSSALMLDTVENYRDELSTELTFIEPYPERLHSLLSKEDRRFCTILEKELQETDLSIFSNLQKNDMVFVDTSHQLKVGSEVLTLLFEIIPLLSPGVMIHFHDIFWPFEYPREWVEVGRSWNEAYALKTFLQYNNEWEILFFNSYMGNIHRKQVNGSLVFGDGIPEDRIIPGGSFDAGGSLWLRRKE